MAEYNTRIKHKRDTSANWTAKDPVLLDGEIIIVETANGGVRKKVGDGTKKYSQLPFDDEVIYNTLAAKSTSTNATLMAAGWSTEGTQILQISGITEGQNGTIGLATDATTEQFDAAVAARLRIGAQSAGTITIVAEGTTPTVNIPVTVVLSY